MFRPEHGNLINGARRQRTVHARLLPTSAQRRYIGPEKSGGVGERAIANAKRPFQMQLI